MKNFGRNPILSFGSLLLAAAWLFVSTAQAASPGAAQVKKVSGTATYTDSKGGGPLKEGAILLEGASITTGAGSYVDLFLGVNGDALRVEADSTLALNKLDYTQAGDTIVNTQLEVKKGSTVANVVNKLSKASKYEIKTPAGVAGIRGTVVRVTTTVVVCLVGRVDFRPANGAPHAVIGGTVYTVGTPGPVKATVAQSTGLAVTATSCTANTHPANVVSQAVQRFTTVIAVDAASGAGVAGAAQAAADAAKTTIMALLAAVKEAADNAPLTIRAAAQAAAVDLAKRIEAIQVDSAAEAAVRGTLIVGGTKEQAKANADKAAAASTTDKLILADANKAIEIKIVVIVKIPVADLRSTVNGVLVGVVPPRTTPVIVPPKTFISPVNGANPSLSPQSPLPPP